MLMQCNGVWFHCAPYLIDSSKHGKGQQAMQPLRATQYKVAGHTHNSIIISSVDCISITWRHSLAGLVSVLCRSVRPCVCVQPSVADTTPSERRTLNPERTPQGTIRRVVGHTILASRRFRIFREDFAIQTSSCPHL